MSEDKTNEVSTQRQGDSPGYTDLSMNEVAASPTAEQSEAGRHASGLALLVIVVLGAAAFIVLGIYALRNAHPGQDAERRLQAKLQDLPAWQTGIVLDARYLAGNRARIGISPGLSLAKPDERERVEEAGKAVMGVLMAERPGRDLYVDGYQADEKIMTVRYRYKSPLVGPGGESIPDIAVFVEGRDDPGMTEAAGGVRPGSGD